MWIKTVDKNNEYITEYTNMDNGMRFSLELYGALHLSFRSGFDEKIDTRTIWEGKHTEEDCNIFKALIKNVDELLHEGASFIDFMGVIDYVQSHKDSKD